MDLGDEGEINWEPFGVWYVLYIFFYFFLVFRSFFKNYFIVVQFQLSAFAPPPHAYQPPQPNPPPSLASTLGLILSMYPL